MSEREHHIEVPRRARYYTIGDSVNAKQIWIVIHGYGQLVRYFIRHFDSGPANTLIVAPEGLSRFYLSDTSGRVGASWMTKEDRLTEIRDQHDYLNYLAARLIDRNPSADLNVLGFSQGTSTAVRWIQQSSVKFRRVILWAGDIPPDTAPEAFSQRVDGKPIMLAVGTQDPYFQEGQLNTVQERLDSMNIPYDLYRFDGTHTIDKELLLRLMGSGQNSPQ